MDILDNVICPKCNGNKFVAKYEATYVYSYIVDSDAPGLKNKEEFLPFLFENREKKGDIQYIQCNNCGAKYPCSFGEGSRGVDLTILRKAIRAGHVENPEFLG